MSFLDIGNGYRIPCEKIVAIIDQDIMELYPQENQEIIKQIKQEERFIKTGKSIKSYILTEEENRLHIYTSNFTGKGLSKRILGIGVMKW